MNAISQTQNAVLMQQARESLKDRWGLAVGVTFVYVLITALSNSTPDHYIEFFPNVHIGIGHTIIGFLINGAMSLGLTIFSLAIARRQDADIAQLFQGFRRFGTAFAAGLYQAVFVLLWLLLLIVPGIIAALSYSLTYYILADDGLIGALDAISKSKQMMRGNKWKLFCLFCRFIGWGFLCILTLGIGFLWLISYATVSLAKFYEDLRDQEASPIIS